MYFRAEGLFPYIKLNIKVEYFKEIVMPCYVNKKHFKKSLGKPNFKLIYGHPVHSSLARFNR